MHPNSLKREKFIFFIYRSELFMGTLKTNYIFENEEITNKELKILENIEKKYDNYRELISKYLSQTWKYERLSKLERAILIYGAYELEIADKPLVINEMIKISKKYIPGESFKYINAVLDKIGTQYEKRLSKTN